MQKTLYELLTDSTTGLGIPCAFSHFRENAPQEPPYVVYMGNGQETFKADDGFYSRRQMYRLEYYFKEKDENAEIQLENWLLAHDFLYEKSEDVYIDTEDIFVIYYYI